MSVILHLLCERHVKYVLNNVVLFSVENTFKSIVIFLAGQRFILLGIKGHVYSVKPLDSQ